ncbi:MAG TPA: hypothetical protein VGD90_02625 [Sphingobacteriaceae bacterium]
MKKLILSFLMICAVVVGAMAKDGAPKPGSPISMVSRDALRDFAFQFFDATNVTWKVDEDYQKAIFNLDGKVVCAMYNNQGQFLMASEQVASSELPETVLASLREDYSDYKISDIVKVVSRPSGYQKHNDIGSYWTALRKDNEVIYLLVAPEGAAKVVRKATISK